ncbi:beta strand repeat-containing protein [Pseudarthrobacter albicanus]|uniref:beta strand repeat-containing protein n=1 Tax=Pseudarthrobacter albicanus TaxID=2823873 RepID=UPI001BA43D43|nr:carboxypeptidase regulatory-like domain-containing protein [Pseudarthrobacter albicanus]
MMLGMVPAIAVDTASASIQGTVTAPAGVSVAGTSVYAYTEASQGQPGGPPVSVSPDGSYKITGLAAGSYKLQFSGKSGGALDQWYQNAASFNTATAVTVTAGQTLTGVNVTLAKGATISGKVTVPAGVIRSSVYVSASPVASQWQMGQYVSVELDGSYKITGLAAGSYKVRFSGWNSGALEQWYQNAASFDTATAVTVTAGQDLTGVNTTLVKGASISGKVTVPAGVNLSNFFVSASSTTSQSQLGQSNLAPDGSYKIAGLAAGSYKLHFSGWNSGALEQWYQNAASFDTATAVTVTAGQDLIGANTTLVKGATISGKVTVPAGANLSNVSVSASSAATRGQMGQSGVAPDGTYNIIGLAAGSYKLRFSGGALEQWHEKAASFDTATALTVTAGQDLTGVNATLMKGATISGKITAPAGVSLSYVSVSASLASSQGPSVQSASVAQDGSYTVAGLPAGSYKLRFSGWNSGVLEQWYGGATSFDTATAVTVIANQDLTGVNATLVKVATISGKVTAPAGVDLSRVSVSASSAASWDMWGQLAFVASDGSYRITGLPAGSYKLRFSGSNSGAPDQWYQNASSFDTATAVTVTAGQDLAGVNTALVKGATISGKVTAPAGVGLSGAEVSASPVASPVASQGPGGQSSSVAPDGSYKIVGLPAGSYKLRFSGSNDGALGQWYQNAASFDTATAVTVTAGQDLTGINASLVKGATISGKVTAPAGVTASNVRVSTWSASSMTPVGQSVSVAPDGSYKILGLPAGSYRLQFWGYDTGAVEQWHQDAVSPYQATAVTVTAGQDLTGVNASLTKGATISGKVAAPAGASPSNVSVSASPAASQGQPSQYSSVAPDGSYKITGLSAGSYKLAFRGGVSGAVDQWYKGGGSFDTATAVTVAAGQDLTGIDAALVKGATISGKVSAPIGVELRKTIMRGITVAATEVRVYPAGSSTTQVARADVGADGNYQVIGLPAGSYKFFISGWNTGAVDQWYDRAASFDAARTLTVAAGQDLTGINPALAAGSTISGKITGAGGKYTPISVLDSAGAVVKDGSADPDGTYSIGGLAAGSYKVAYNRASGSSLAEAQFYNNKPESAGLGAAQALTVGASQKVANIDATLVTGGSITGTLTDKAGKPLPNAGVQAYTRDGSLTTRSGGTDSSGRFSLTGLSTGKYFVVAQSGADGTKIYSGNVVGEASATPVAVTVGQPTDVGTLSFGSAPLALTGAPVPTVTGTPVAGQKLTAVPGAWGPAPVTLAYQWKRSGVNILGATAASYTLTAGDVGKTITVTVTGSKAGYTTTAKTSAATSAVTALPALAAAPVPTVTGTSVSGQKLTAVPGTWAPAPVTLAYQWKRSGVVVAGATAASYTLTAGDVGKTITVTVTGSKAGYTTTATSSAATTAVTAAPLALTAAPVPTVTGSTVSGQKLTAVPGTWAPAPVTLAYQWKRAGVNIVGATAATYVLTTADVGKTVTVTVTGSKAGYTTAAKTSAATKAVTAPLALTAAPVPTVTGSTVSGQKLTAVPGTWAPAPVTLAYQWKRAGLNIVGATAATYVLTTADVGKTVTVTVTGSKAGYTTAAKTSVASKAVMAG